MFKKLIVACLSVVLTGLIFGAPSYANPTPPQPQQFTVTLTQDQIQVLRRALDLAAGTCSQQQDGCIIGINRGALQGILGAAKPAGKK